MVNNLENYQKSIRLCYADFQGEIIFKFGDIKF